MGKPTVGPKEQQLRELRERKLKSATVPKVKIKSVGRVVNVKAMKRDKRV